MTVKSLVLFCLIFLVTNAEVLKAGASVCNSRPFYSSKIQSRDFHANDTTSNRIENDRIRPWTISVPVWIPGYKGQFTVGGVEVGGEPDGDFFDRLFSSEIGLDFYFVGLVNYKWQQWDFQANVFSGSIGKSTVFTLDNKKEVNAKLNMVMPNMFAAYDLLYNSAPLGPVTNWSVYLGGRLYFMDISVIWPADSGTKEDKTSWITLIFGTHITIKIIEHVRLMLSGDIGGFIDSGAPDLFGSAYVHYQPWDLFSVSLGYAAIHIVRVRNSPQDIGLKADLSGPVLGIAFHF